MRFLMMFLIILLSMHSQATEIANSDTIIGRTKNHIIVIDTNKIIDENNIQTGDKSAKIKRVWLIRYDDYNNKYNDMTYFNATAHGYFSYWQTVDCTHKRLLQIVGSDNRPDIVIPDNIEVIYKIDGYYLTHMEVGEEYAKINEVLFDKVC